MRTHVFFRALRALRDVRRRATSLACVASCACAIAATAACSRDTPHASPTPPPDPPAAAGDDARAGALEASVPGSSSSVAVVEAPSATAPARAAAGGGPTGATSTATVKLLDPGKPPRRKLRYAWRVGQHEDLTMDLRTAASTETAGTRQPEIQLPTMRIAIGLDPQRVAADTQALTYAWRVTSAGLAGDDADASPYAPGMSAEIGSIERLSGTAVVTSRGLAEDIAIDPASMREKDGGAGYMVEQIRQTLRDLVTAMPEEDVGRGARWQKLSQILSKDEAITQTDTITLSEISGDKGTLDDVLAQTAPPQPLRMPGATARTKMESMLTSGDAATRFDLTRLVPSTKFDGTTTMVVSEDRAQVTMIMRLGIVIQGAVQARPLQGAAH